MQVCDSLCFLIYLSMHNCIYSGRINVSAAHRTLVMIFSVGVHYAERLAWCPIKKKQNLVGYVT